MKTFLFLIISLLTFQFFAQDSLKIGSGKPIVTPEMRKVYRKNQHKLDMNHGGIGLTLYRPGLGEIVSSEKPWIGVNILSDIFELKFGFGNTEVNGLIPYGFGQGYIYTREVGTQFSIGVNIPVSFLSIGAQRSPLLVFRGHPVLSTELGAYHMHDENYFKKPSSSIYYLGINPGYRIRIPLGSIEFNYNLRLGIRMGENDKYYKGIGGHPSITLRVDALKWRYNPNMISAKGVYVSTTNVNSTTYNTGTRYNQDGSRVEYYTTYTTADVNVSNFNFGIQDIGPHIGIGPKFSFMNPRRKPYIPLGQLYGAVIEGRIGAGDFGFCVEKGEIGHGGRLQEKNEFEGEYYYRLDKSKDDDLGTLTVTNAYFNFGFDISPMLLMPLGIGIDKGKATSFFSITSGFIIGIHTAKNHQFIDTLSSPYFQNMLLIDNGKAKEQFIDPSKSKTGFLGGFYISAQVGALNFKITKYKYHGAPFASTVMCSIAYRVPIIYKRDK